MSWDIYGNPLRRGYCEVHPDVHQEYPCSICMAQKQQQSQPHNELDQLQYEFAQQGGYIRHLESERAALAAQVEALKRDAVPNEQGKNRYGLDVAYFRNVINRELNRSLMDFKPSELARVFARLSRSADDSVLLENEFIGEHLAEIRAQAGRDGVLYMHQKLACEYAGYGTQSDAAEAEKIANQYADSIRQGVK